MENMLGSLLCLPGPGSVLLDPYGSTVSETTSEAWSVEVLPSDSGKQSWREKSITFSAVARRNRYCSGEVRDMTCKYKTAVL